MSASGLSAIHIVPKGQTVDAECYVKDILEKQVKPLLKRSKRTNEATTNNMVVIKGDSHFNKMVPLPTPTNAHRIGVFKNSK